jgi:predicted RNA-binding Zn-ribbon protein involved in translation (DUF1610 family)
MTGLSAEQRQHITAVLQEAGAVLPCPRCGNAGFTLMDGYVLEFRQSQLRNMVVGSGNRLPSVVMTCDRCGFISQHDMRELGLQSAD